MAHLTDKCPHYLSILSTTPIRKGFDLEKFLIEGVEFHSRSNLFKIKSVYWVFP